MLDVYLAPLNESGAFSAFVDGTWVDGPVATSAVGWYQFNSQLPGSVGDYFSAEFLVVGADTVTYRMEGTPVLSGGAFALAVNAMVGPVVVATDTLSAIKR